MSIIELKVDRKNFKVDINFDDIIRRAEILKEDFEDEYINYLTENISTKEDFECDIDKLINYVKAFRDNNELLELLVVKPAPKKKDGWLAKGRINRIVLCDNVSYKSEDEYGYRVYCLKTKNTSANEIEVQFVDDIIPF